MEKTEQKEIIFDATAVKEHRKRLKEKFLKTKFDGWYDYEILEFILFFSVPRKDTKPLAKKLIKKFGSLKEVLTADYAQLKKAFKDIKGVGDHTIFFFYFLKNISLKYSEFKIKEKEKISSSSEVIDFLKNFIGGCDEEKMIAIYLNSSNKVLDYNTISSGTVSRSAVYPTKVAQQAILTKARGVIIAHNHPGGVCKPSQNDIIATEAVSKALKTIETVLLDHIIVTSSDYYSFKDNGLI